jgi:hypothetical protein
VLEWLREMLGLPVDFEGVIADRASTASLLAIAAARDAVAPEIGALGMAGCGGMPKLLSITDGQIYLSRRALSAPAGSQIHRPTHIAMRPLRQKSSRIRTPRHD